MSKNIKHILVFSLLLLLLLLYSLSCSNKLDGNNQIFIGDEPSIKTHLKQENIESGKISIEQLISHGEDLFQARFNSLDGLGRPLSSGNRTRRDKKIFPENFNLFPEGEEVMLLMYSPPQKNHPLWILIQKI